MQNRIALALGTATLALATATPALAGSPDGAFQVKAFVTLVSPEASIEEVQLDLTGALVAGSDTEGDDNVVPTLAAEYFVTPNVSLETICCLTQHDVTGIGSIDGAELVSDVKVLPATLTLKAHLPLGNGIKPYVGAGPTYFFFIDEQPGEVAEALGATRQQLNDHFGFALQAGADVALNDRGLSFSIDAKRYFVETTARWFAGDVEAIRTRHTIDPWVLSAGLAYRF